MEALKLSVLKWLKSLVVSSELSSCNLDFRKAYISELLCGIFLGPLSAFPALTI